MYTRHQDQALARQQILQVRLSSWENYRFKNIPEARASLLAILGSGMEEASLLAVHTENKSHPISAQELEIRQFQLEGGLKDTTLSFPSRN